MCNGYRGELTIRSWELKGLLYLVNDALDISCIAPRSYLEGTWYLQEDAWCFDSFLLEEKNHGLVGQMPKPVD